MSYRRESEYTPAEYIFPVNMSDDGGVLGGWFKKRNLIEAIVLLAAGVMIWRFFSIPLPIAGKVILFILLAVPGPILAVAGLGSRSLGEWVSERISQSKRARIMTFRIPREEEQKKSLFSVKEVPAKKQKKQKAKENKKAARALKKKQKKERRKP